MAPPYFGSFDRNTFHLARHALHTKRYGLDVNQAAARVLDPARWSTDFDHTMKDLSDVTLAVLDADRARPGSVDWRAVFRAQLLVRFFVLHFAPADYRRFAREKLQTDGRRQYIEAMEWELSPEARDFRRGGRNRSRSR